MSGDPDPRWPAEQPPDDLIDAAAEMHDVDLDHAVVGFDADAESSRIYIIEEAGGGYRLISFGQDAEDRIPSDDPIHIPESAVGAVQGLLHAAGMHTTNRGLLTGGESKISIRDLAEAKGISKPVGTGYSQSDDPEDLGDAETHETAGGN